MASGQGPKSLGFIVSSNSSEEKEKLSLPGISGDRPFSENAGALRREYARRLRRGISRANVQVGVRPETMHDAVTPTAQAL
jgi:hypothetical protein